ncbi:MAG: hypothetical protein ACJ741_07990 [Pyrinomonadaceae bacterium]
MVRELRRVLRLRHAPRARALSCLLLFLISLNATADVVHRHDLSSPRQTSIARATVDAVDAAGETTDGSTGSPLNSKDCPLCQLHKQLSSALICEPVFSPAPPSQCASVIATSISYLSASATARRGRAPPQTSLL